MMDASRLRPSRRLLTDITRVLAVADAKIFRKSYGDQSGELWSPNGRLLATTAQIAFFKA
jgi:hypothetical protein